MRLLPTLAALAATLLLAACAAVEPRQAAPAFLFADDLFGSPSEHVGAEKIFAVSEEMRTYAYREMVRQIRWQGSQEGLIDALYRSGRLKLEYDTALTRTASQAFEARAGNCLSLVIMTAAFAKELGMRVSYQSAYLEEPWSRRGDLLVKNGHVNVTLGRRPIDSIRSSSNATTIDFMPTSELRGLKTREIPESTVVAMFMNNRAVEVLVDGRLDDAYAWARAAVLADPEFLAALNTLGVVYLRRGALAQAATAFEYVLAHDAIHTRALANLSEVAERQGRTADAAHLRARLAQLEPEAPLHYFNLGMAAMRREDFRAARDLFAQEASRGDADAEVHYWLGVAHFQLGDVDQAARALRRAAEASASRSERDLYSAKLAWLRARGAQ